MEEMERLLEESIKESPPKERATTLHEEKQKRKVDHESRMDEENEEDGEKEKDDKEEEEDNKDSCLPVRPSASFRKPNSRRKGIPHRAPLF
jgi:hypothetical protein